MKITNEYNLPEVFYNAVVNDTYDPGESDITTTQLKDSPRIVTLKKRFADQIEEDCSNMVYAVFGKAVHTLFEGAAEDGAIIEERYYADILGWKVGGQIDHFNAGVLTDFKVTSAYVVKGHLSGEKNDWHCQMNTNRFLMKENDIEVEKLQIIVLLRDWSKLEAARDLAQAKQFNRLPHYPQHQIQVVDIPLWSLEDTRKWIERRVFLHREARRELPLCSDEDRWKKPDKWAVMNAKAKRALKLHDNEDQAHLHAEDQAALWVQPRPGTPVRCESYCSAAPFCEQYQTEIRKEAS